MSSYCYEAVDAGGLKMQGTLDVADQNEALRRIREMGLFPVKIAEFRQRRKQASMTRTKSEAVQRRSLRNITLFSRRPKGKVLSVFTRQLSTLINAGMPLLRGLRTLEEQEINPALKKILGDLSLSIENGSSLSEALGNYPRVFNPLYLNMVKAGELGGALEITLRRLAEFMEKAQRIKSKVKSAMFYPAAVLFVAITILSVLMVFVIPKFKEVFDGLLNGASMPAFTLFVLRISDVVKSHFLMVTTAVAIGAVALTMALKTKFGRRLFDRFKLTMPVLGPVFRKVAIARFTRTLGTLLNSGVPVLQALMIVRETAGNVVVGSVIGSIHDSVKEGETISVPLKASRVFPAMVAGMVDIGEQTGALPDMLMKIADTYDDEVDDSVNAMTSLLEPIMIVFLAVIVGSIVIAMFLPIIAIVNGGLDNRGSSAD
ncbi:MAG TPA: type II secretion system F family protein [Candidatus Paceibacterota bacterium]|nr:type II secretion system F family protein [Candidatus Paceibacterota bacterium]